MAHLKINNPSKGAVSAACLQHACFSKKIGEHPGKLFSNLLELAQLKNQNTHKMAPRGEKEYGAILAGT